MVTIFGHQERTGLAVEDIWASWPDIYPGTAPSESLEVLSKSHAFRLVAWLKKQPDAPVPEVEAAVSCTCEAVALAMLDAEAEPSPEAQALWAGTLEILREALPGTTFDTWLQETAGVALRRATVGGEGSECLYGDLVGAADVSDDTAGPAGLFRPRLGCAL